jgi:hypothetical protein
MSATGYIEDPFIATQIRIRADAGWDDNTPDRAEFFYPKCGCYGSGAPGPQPGIVTNLRFQEYSAAVEYAVVRRFSIFVEAPFRSIQPVSFAQNNTGFPDHAGFSDFRSGFKWAVDSNPNRYMTVQVRAYFPTGDASRGLGTNHYSVEPSFLFQQTLTPRTRLAGEAALWIPAGGSSNAPVNNGQFSGSVLTYGLGLTYTLWGRPERRGGVRVVPALEFVGWNVRSGSVTEATGLVDASNTDIANLKIGARIFANAHDSVYAGVGRQLTHIGWYRDLLRVEYRHTF